MIDFDPDDVIYVNAGATRPVDPWLDRLKDGGRLILALTMHKEARGAWFGIERRGDEFLAKWICAADLFPCEDARDAESEGALVAAFERGGPGTGDAVLPQRRGARGAVLVKGAGLGAGLRISLLAWRYRRDNPGPA
jgi:hypothetical protein